MIIEIVGVDGSGKTTLAHGLRRYINESGNAFAYERNFQSDGVRLLEAAASLEKRSRPIARYSREVIEHVRAVELAQKSFGLLPYSGSLRQHVFTDSHVIEQLGRALQYGLKSDAFLALLKTAVQADHILYIRITPEIAVERMRSRPKGDSILLAADPVNQASEVIDNLEDAMRQGDQLSHTVLDGAQSPEALVRQALNALGLAVNK